MPGGPGSGGLTKLKEKSGEILTKSYYYEGGEIIGEKGGCC